ncbi:MAG: NUDIX domain-containing protein, partial [Candidatus Diapherotrites archaeon]|nr:NUDIX domain-containing protein [Candidatus Diapherotrites archaeon]
MKQRIRQNVLGVVLCKDKVLIVKQITPFKKNPYWSFPKGGIEKGETQKQALARELQEEIGLKNGQILGKSRHYLAYSIPFAL